MTISRVSAIRRIILKRNCTHILISDPADVEYVSGFRSSNATLLISRRKLDLYTDFRYKETAQAFCAKNPVWNFHLIEQGNYRFLSGAVEPGSVMGIQSDVMTVDQFHELKRTLKKVKFLPLSSELGSLAVQKTEDELYFMRKAARIGDKAFKSVLPEIKEGMTERELAKLLETYCLRYGSDRPSFDTIVLFGTRSALPHGRPGEKKLSNNDFILFDFGCTVNGFCSDMSRTVVYGKASPRQRHIYDVVFRAQAQARSEAKAGIKASKLDKAARDLITKEKLGEYFGHATGHGVGLKIHEKPRISQKNDTALLENSVVTIEPGVYVPDLGGVRIEDMVVLDKSGSTLVTHSPRNLIELDL
ncbi:MAG: aminopeptidase P family protein [Chitinispirillaceae bacterium]